MTLETLALRSLSPAAKAWRRRGHPEQLLRGHLLSVRVDRRVPEPIRLRVIDRLAPRWVA